MSAFLEVTATHHSILQTTQNSAQLHTLSNLPRVTAASCDQRSNSNFSHIPRLKLWNYLGKGIKFTDLLICLIKSLFFWGRPICFKSKHSMAAC